MSQRTKDRHSFVQEVGTITGVYTGCAFPNSVKKKLRLFYHKVHDRARIKKVKDFIVSIETELQGILDQHNLALHELTKARAKQFTDEENIEFRPLLENRMHLATEKEYLLKELENITKEISTIDLAISTTRRKNEAAVQQEISMLTEKQNPEIRKHISEGAAKIEAFIDEVMGKKLNG